MIKFRLKTFSKFRTGVKKTIDKGKDIWDNHKAEIGVVGTGISAVNLATNLHRGNNEKKFQKEQIEATNKLTNAINSTNSETKELLKKNRRLIKKSQKPYVQDRSSVKPIEDIKNNIVIVPKKQQNNDKI